MNIPKRNIVVLLLVLLTTQAALAYYCPSTGCWPSRDPIEERGGANLREFVRNNPVSFEDKVGLQIDILDPILEDPILEDPIVEEPPVVEEPTPTPRPTPKPIPPPIPIPPPHQHPNPNPNPNPSPSPNPQPSPVPNPINNPVNAPPATVCGCPECKPYPVGTIGYQSDSGHTHYPSGDPHLHLFQVSQNPKTCKCFWNKADPDSANPPPDPKWVNLGTRGDPFPPFTY